MAIPLRDTFGLDISTNALTAVDAVLVGQGVKVLNYSRVELEPDIVEGDSIIVNPEEFKAALQKLLKGGVNGPFANRNVVISISEGKVFSHQVSIPTDKVSDVNFLLGAARDYLPIELSDAIVDYRPLKGESDGKHVTFNFVAVQKNLVDSLVQILAEAGLRVVAVDVGRESLIRACQFVRAKGAKPLAADLLVIDIEGDGAHFYLQTAGDGVYSLDSSVGGRRAVEKIKKYLSVPTLADAKNRLLSMDAKDPSLLEGVRAAIKSESDNWISKARELIRIVEGQRELKLGQLHLVGGYACSVVLRSLFEDAFPGTEVRAGIPQEMPKGSDCDYVRALGLALRAVSAKAHEESVDLLPIDRRDEIESSLLRPMVLRGLVVGAMVALGLGFLGGRYMAQNILGVKIAERELRLSQEKIQNPYLNKLAQASQQKSRLESEIETILKQSLPLQVLTRKIDSFNRNGLGLVNVGYNENAAGVLELRLQAKSDSRETTEKFILELDKEPFFSNLVSPLSNLVGKGERFVNMDMTVNPDQVISAYEEELLKREETLKESEAVSSPEADQGGGGSIVEPAAATPGIGVEPESATTPAKP